MQQTRRGHFREIASEPAHKPLDESMKQRFGRSAAGCLNLKELAEISAPWKVPSLPTSFQEGQSAGWAARKLLV